MRHSAHELILIHKVLSRQPSLRGQIEDRFLFTGHVPLSVLNQLRDSIVFWGNLHKMTIERMPRIILGEDKEESSLE
jgi:hypothetical protein